MFVFVLEMPVNYVIIKTFAIKNSNSHKIIYRKLMCVQYCSQRKERSKDFFFKFWFVRLLALRPLLAYCTGCDKQTERNYSMRSTYIVAA
jgi:hypothetical protein